jgi:flagellar biosynthetic protein FliR
MTALEALAPLLDLTRTAVYAAVAVFARVGAAVTLLPGFGEQVLPPRVKLGAALAFAIIIWPAVADDARIAEDSLAGFGLVLAAEAVAGIMLGLSVRLLIFALQIAGSIAAQSTSIAQMFGEGLVADPQPAYANLLAVAGIAMAFALGLPVHVAAALIDSYATLGFGQFPLGSDLADWGSQRVAAAFGTALSLALPFVLMAFAYNVALGAINRAMPQLMVAFVGAPAITGGALLVMGLATPFALQVWGQALLRVLANPFGTGS